MITRIILSPVWLLGFTLSLLGIFNPQCIKGIVLGCLFLTASLILVQPDNRIPVSADFLEEMIQAKAEGENPWSEPMDLVAISLDEPEVILPIPVEEIVPVPARKPERDGYTLSEIQERQAFVESYYEK